MSEVQQRSVLAEHATISESEVVQFLTHVIALLVHSSALVSSLEPSSAPLSFPEHT